MTQRLFVIDYGSFEVNDQYENSVDELIDSLSIRGIQAYAIIPIDIKKELPVIDIRIKGVISIEVIGIYRNQFNIIENTLKVANCSNPDNIVVISKNSSLLSIYEQFGFKIIRINNGYNDTIDINSKEINKIKQITKII